MAVEDCLGVVSRWIRRSVRDMMWAAYNKLWQEWLSLLQQAVVEQEGPKVRLLVLYFVSRNIEEGVLVSVVELKLAG